MKTLLQSNATKVIILMFVAQMLVELAPMLRNHSIDVWKLGEQMAIHAAALIGNALRPDINAPGLNWFNKDK
jgi:hypothetical protein